MANNMTSKDLGPATAYAIAVENGYTGTEEQWASEIANASNNAQIASQKASDAEAYAAGTRGGEAVESDDPAYQNNAEYYSGEAADSAEAAAGSATSAAESAATASAAYNVNLLAPNFVQETAYPAGQHVINDGGYYVLPNGHEADTTWENTTKTQLTVGAEAADLKSALEHDEREASDITGNIKSGVQNLLLGVNWEPNSIGTNGADNNTGKSIRSNNYIDLNGATGKVHFTFKAGDGIRVRIHFYDASKTLISYDTSNVYTDGLTNGYTPIPSGSKYVRFLLGNSSWGKISDYYSYVNRFACWVYMGEVFMDRGRIYSDTDIDALLTMGFYQVINSGSGWKPTNWPLTGGGRFIVLRYDKPSTDTAPYFGTVQIILSGSGNRIRFGTNTAATWTDWQIYQPYSVVEGELEKAFMERDTLSDSDDIDAITTMGFYQVIQLGEHWKPTNWPLTSGARFLVLRRTVSPSATAPYFGTVQMILSTTGNRIRFGKSSGATWTDWQIYQPVGENNNIVYLNDEVTTKLKLQQISNSIAGSQTPAIQPLTLLHFSDLHNNSTALKRIVEFRDYYSDFIIDSIHTGDSIGNISQSNIFGTVEGAGNILNVIGNHDTWKNESPNDSAKWHYLDEQGTYETYIEPFISSWGSGLHTVENKAYYYKDYDGSNVRLIVLDCMHETSAQLDWFAETLSSASGRHVLIADHVKMAMGNALTYLDSGFDTPTYNVKNSSTPGSYYPECVASGYVDAVDSFVSNGGVVIAWICGHIHADSLATYHNILNVMITTAGDLAHSRTYDERVAGSKSYDAFNIIGVDTVRKRLSLVRIGLDYNNAMRKKDTLCWDYENHRLMHTT